MIQGVITEYLDALIPLRIRGKQAGEFLVHAVVDTGFNDYLTLPPEIISSLNLSFFDTVSVVLGNGVVVNTDLFLAYVVWQEEVREITVQSAAGDALVGMRLLLDNQVTLQVRPHGSVVIEAIP